MKPLSMALGLCLLLLPLVGCTGMQNAIYDDDTRIAANADSYTATVSIGTGNGSSYRLTATMTGADTVWTYTADEDCEVTMTAALSVSGGGKAKLVLVTPDDTVTTLLENDDNSDMEEPLELVLPLQTGKNRIKIVGQESPAFLLELAADVGRFGS